MKLLLNKLTSIESLGTLFILFKKKRGMNQTVDYMNYFSLNAYPQLSQSTTFFMIS